MAKDSLWTTKMKEREDRISEVRNDLIQRLAKDTLGYGALSHGEIAKVMKTTQPSVSRLLKKGKNTSRPMPDA